MSEIQSDSESNEEKLVDQNQEVVDRTDQNGKFNYLSSHADPILYFSIGNKSIHQLVNL